MRRFSFGSRARAAATAFGLLLGGCTAAGPPVPTQPPLTSSDEATESRLLAQNPEIAHRQDRFLRLWHRTKAPLALEDRPCGDDTADDCVEYRLDAVFQGGNVAGVSLGYYEGSSYQLYSVRGDGIEVGDRPIAAPDNRHLISAASSDASYPPDTGVSLIAVDGANLRLVRRITPWALTAYENLRWLSPRCASFTASMVTAEGHYGDQPRHAWYLVDDTPEWRLTRDRELVCGA